VIATSIRGNREVIQDSVNGLLFPPRDVKQLTARLRLLYDQPALRSRIGQQARTAVLARFDERDFVARQIVEVERLLSQRGVPRSIRDVPIISPERNSWA
jgi:glycosyltransferase involved in cell wall biosynthesis